MAQRKEKLQEEVVTKLRTFQAKANDSMLAIGEIELRLRELNVELERVSTLKSKFLGEYDDAVAGINGELKALEMVYPKGEIDLVEGIVTIEE